MPPKRKFTANEIAAAALAIVKEQGVAALTARELGKRLGCSASPIFTVFQSMDEVKWAARTLALREFEAYISDYEDYTPAFKRIGTRMVSYAIREPELFKLLFLQQPPQGQDFEDTIHGLGPLREISLRLIRRDYGLSLPEANTLFEQVWVHTFGMGVLCATRACTLSEAEINEMLGQIFGGMMLLIHSGKSGAAAHPILPVGQRDKGEHDELPY